MRPFVLGASLLLLAGCVVYERYPYSPGPAPYGPVRRIITQEQAIEQAFRYSQDRDLRVDRVQSATLDSAGRWHVTLLGYVDRAQMLLDGRDGKLLKGRFSRGGAPPSPRPPAAPPSGIPPSPSAQPPPPQQQRPPEFDDLD